MDYFKRSYWNSTIYIHNRKRVFW